MRRGAAVAAVAIVLVAGLLTAPAASAEVGDLDPAFGHRGYVAVPVLKTSRSVALPGDGRILVAGADSDGRPTIVALTAEGELDTDYGNGGATEPLPGRGAVTDLALDEKGRAVLLTSDPEGGSSTLTRFAAGGVPDPSFGTAGSVAIGKSGGVEIDGRGRLIVWAAASVRRFLEDGSPDLSWDEGEADLLEHYMSTPTYVEGAVPDSEDRVLVASQPNYGRGGLKILRIREADGSLDTSFPITFASRGQARLMVGDHADGAYVSTYNCVRYCSSGAFHIDGTAEFGPIYDRNFYPRGPLLAAGPGNGVTSGGGFRVRYPYTPYTGVFTRAGADGATDLDFGVDGHVYLYPRGKSAWASDLAVDGRTTIISTTAHRDAIDRVMVARLLGGGSAADADADGRADDEDGCPAIPSARNEGCRNTYERRINLRADAGRAFGRVRGVPACRTHVRVKLVRAKRHGRRKVLGRVETDYKGQWELPVRLSRGRYLANSPKTFGAGSGICPRVRSKILRLR